jgi:hypothetical protein
MVMSSFNAYRTTQLNSEIMAVKSKTDLLMDISHLHHLQDKTHATNRLLSEILELNIWFSSKITVAKEKKFQLMVHQNENVIKSAQHH